MVSKGVFQENFILLWKRKTKSSPTAIFVLYSFHSEITISRAKSPFFLLAKYISIPHIFFSESSPCTFLKQPWTVFYISILKFTKKKKFSNILSFSLIERQKQANLDLFSS